MNHQIKIPSSGSQLKLIVVMHSYSSNFWVESNACLTRSRRKARWKMVPHAANDNSLWMATITINATTRTVMLTVTAMDDNDRPGHHSL